MRHKNVSKSVWVDCYVRLKGLNDEGIWTKNQRRQEPGPTRLFGGMDIYSYSLRHLVSQCARYSLYKAVLGPIMSSRWVLGQTVDVEGVFKIIFESEEIIFSVSSTPPLIGHSRWIGLQDLSEQFQINNICNHVFKFTINWEIFA